MTTAEIINASLEQARTELEAFLAAPETVKAMEEMVGAMHEVIEAGGKIMSCGNGGSLCDATHFAEELTGRFRGNRRPLPAMSINDPAYMTCVGNDFSFQDIFSRWVRAFGKPGDILLAISTSGNSPDVVDAAKAAREIGMKVIGLTSEGKNAIAELSDVAICVPEAPHSDGIQEIHIKVIHITIEALEHSLGVA